MWKHIKRHRYVGIIFRLTDGLIRHIEEAADYISYMEQ